ncbi:MULTISPECIES: ECF transporter S component [Helcococcus]|uniref:ECF transporter S component n=1 Tax=Helcococcus bovis TaxID=3153252 RepID=A0ABW9F580_9FIRM
MKNTSLGEIIQKDKSNKFTTVKITYMAIFVALGVMVNTLRVGMLSFGGFPIIISGFLLGPIPGFIVGGVTDIAAFIVRPSSYPFNILFSLTSALTGMIPVVIANLLGAKYPKYSLVKIFVGILIGQVLTSVVLVPIFSVWLYGRNSVILLMTKALTKQAISIPVYAVIIKILIDRFTKVIDFEKEFR